MSPEARDRARAAVEASLSELSDEEDARITADAERDPDGRPMSDEAFARARRVPPPGEGSDGRLVRLRLDADVLDALKAGGRGWQGRLNAILREALKPRR